MADQVIVVSGGFDPAHRGHVRMFEEAAEHGDIVVLLNSDEWLIRKKKKLLMTWEDRASVVGNFKKVIDVLSFDDYDKTVVDGLKKARSKFGNIVFANGGDRGLGSTPEVEFCQKWGIPTLWNIGGGKEQSSSTILREYVGETVERPWGSWCVIRDWNNVKVKELSVKPGHSLSYQKHNHRSEYWMVVRGTAKIRLGEWYKTLEEQDDEFIPCGEWHQIINDEDEELVIVEIQYGDKCVEDDIERK